VADEYGIVLHSRAEFFDCEFRMEFARPLFLPQPERVQRCFVGNLRFAKVPLPQNDNVFDRLRLTEFT
jgi:hypothetical protein